MTSLISDGTAVALLGGSGEVPLSHGKGEDLREEQRQEEERAIRRLARSRSDGKVTSLGEEHAISISHSRRLRREQREVRCLESKLKSEVR